jgi:hypothetical protein
MVSRRIKLAGHVHVALEARNQYRTGSKIPVSEINFSNLDLNGRAVAKQVVKISAG